MPTGACHRARDPVVGMTVLPDRPLSPAQAQGLTGRWLAAGWLAAFPCPGAGIDPLPPAPRRATEPAMRYVLLLLVALFVSGTSSFIWFAWHRSIAPITPPTRASFRPRRRRPRRPAGGARRLHLLPYHAGRHALRRRTRGADAVRHRLRQQHHAGPRDRHRRLVGSGLPARHARGRGPRRPAALPGLSVRPLHPGHRCRRLRPLCLF